LYVFQQDSTPAHRARDTVQLLQQETPEFIAPDLWPPNSPHLNTVDYRVWVSCRNEFTRLQCVTQLTSSSASLRLGRAFHRLPSKKPLTSGGYDCELAKGRPFEHSL